MNWLDKLFEGVAPGWVANRVRSRMLLQAYEAAMPSRTHKAKREHRSGNQATMMAGRSLREQARWLDENHDIAIGILDKLEERVVGARGIVVEPQPRQPDGTIHDEFAAEIRRRWAEFSLRPEATQTMTRPRAERMVCRTWLRDGECFGQKLMGTVPGFAFATKTQFAVELLEPDLVPIDLTDPSNRIRQGIKTNAWGQPVAYQVLYDHPGDATGIRFKTKAIAAERMYHIKLTKRLHQLRGVSLFHGIITRLADLKDVEESERVAARIAAALAFYIKKGDAGIYDTESAPEKPREFPIAPGMTFDDLLPGEDVGTIQPNRPNTALNIWRGGQLQSVAAGSRSSYSTIARDYNGTYSAQRQELVESFEGYAVLQDEFVAQWSRPFYRDWLAMELLTDLKVPADLDRATLFDAFYQAPSMPWIDPGRESTGWKTQIRGGAATEAEWIRARGRNPDEVKRQREAELKWNREHGIVTDTDPANDKGQTNETNPANGGNGNGRGRSTD